MVLGQPTQPKKIHCRVRWPSNVLRVHNPESICLLDGRQPLHHTGMYDDKINSIKHYMSEHDCSWLYCTRWSADGCFKLKNWERGVEDVDFDTGGAYFVEENRYRRFLHDTCNDLVDQVSDMNRNGCALISVQSGLHMWIHTSGYISSLDKGCERVSGDRSGSH
jgi:hypothetical protein